VLLPAPDACPALTNYQEAGQVPADRVRGWQETVFGGKSASGDSKTGRLFCREIMQKRLFA
jgi:hypothetical protein